MAATLRFSMEAVAGILEHAKNAPGRKMTMDQRAEQFGDDKVDTPQPGEEALTPVGLWFVKDSGIYLMSPGVYPEGQDPHKIAEAEKAAMLGTKPSTKVPLTYAEGYNPELATSLDDSMALYDKCRDAVGGDDFCEFIPAQWVEIAKEHRADAFVIGVSANSIGLRVPPKPKPKPPHRRPSPDPTGKSKRHSARATAASLADLRDQLGIRD